MPCDSTSEDRTPLDGWRNIAIALIDPRSKRVIARFRQRFIGISTSDAADDNLEDIDEGPKRTSHKQSSSGPSGLGPQA